MVTQTNTIFLKSDVNKYSTTNSDAHRYVKCKV
jgi:hypothetical protein